MILANVPALRSEMLRIALRILRRVDLAEDAVQIALMKVWYANLADEDVRGTAIVAAKNAALNILRDKKAQRIALNGEMALEVALQPTVETADPRFDVLWELNLSNRHYDMISLLLSGHTQARAAEIIGISHDNFRQELGCIRKIASAEIDGEE